MNKTVGLLQTTWRHLSIVLVDVPLLAIIIIEALFINILIRTVKCFCYQFISSFRIFL